MTRTRVTGIGAIAGLVVVAAVAVAATTSGADAQERVRWKMQSTFASNLSVLGEAGVRFSDKIREISGGTLIIEFFEPNALVPSLEGFGAAQSGAVDAVWGTAGYHTGKIPALAFFTAVPFGPGPGEILAWLYEGGGDEIYDRLYAENGLKGLHCGIISPEASGWFRNPIDSPEQLAGLKMRFFGLGAQVMQKLGVNTQLLAAAEIYPALERGVIDATEFSMPSIDLDLGFHQVAKNYYFPGWHQQASVLELLLNKEQWDALSDQHKAMIEAVCGDNIRYSLARAEAQQAKALAELEQKGVQIREWSPEMLEALRQAWDDVIAEQSESDPVFKEVYENYAAFREEYAKWKDYGYLR